MKRKQMKAFETPKEALKLKPIRIENGDGQELTVCHKCNGEGKVVSREEGKVTCPDCGGAGMRRMEAQQ